MVEMSSRRENFSFCSAWAWLETVTMKRFHTSRSWRSKTLYQVCTACSDAFFYSGRRRMNSIGPCMSITIYVKTILRKSNIIVWSFHGTHKHHLCSVGWVCLIFIFSLPCILLTIVDGNDKTHIRNYSTLHVTKIKLVERNTKQYTTERIVFFTFHTISTVPSCSTFKNYSISATLEMYKKKQNGRLWNVSLFFTLQTFPKHKYCSSFYIFSEWVLFTLGGLNRTGRPVKSKD